MNLKYREKGINGHTLQWLQYLANTPQDQCYGPNRREKTEYYPLQMKRTM